MNPVSQHRSLLRRAAELLEHCFGAGGRPGRAPRAMVRSVRTAVAAGTLAAALATAPAFGLETPAAGAIVAGASHTVAIKSDGTVWAWGDNSCGQLGDGTTTTRSTPVRVAGLSDVVSVAVGADHTVALKRDGTVWAWGDNTFGQLGDGTTTRRTSPVSMSGLSGIVAVSAGSGFSVALSEGRRRLYACGRNGNGQLGDGTYSERTVPTSVTGFPKAFGYTGVVAIASGSGHTVALKEDGTVWAWGMGHRGQLGNGSTTDSLQAVQLSGPTLITALAAGANHTVARASDGTVWAWGDNASGQLGDGTTERRLLGVRVPSLVGATAVSAGLNHTVALMGDGSVLACGGNQCGQLGDGTTVGRLVPAQVGVGPGVAAVAAGGEHTVALLSDGSVWGWGKNTAGQLGVGTQQWSRPGPVAGVGSVVAVAAGEQFALVLRQDGTVQAWGDSIYGQLGRALSEYSSVPEAVPGVAGVAAIAAGSAHAVVLGADGTVWTWGRNTYGQLGNGSTAHSLRIPRRVEGLTGVSAVAAGTFHSVALKGDGTVWTWGRGDFGQLGNGAMPRSQATPVQVAGLTGVVAIEAGAYHTVALKSNGTVWAWGWNYYGELGDGTTTLRITPVQAYGLTGVRSVAAGGTTDDPFTVVVKSDGTAWAFGANSSGQLGDGSATSRKFPTKMLGVSSAESAAAGGRHSVLRMADGSIWACGGNSGGQIGDGTAASRFAAVRIAGLQSVRGVAAGGDFTLALQNDGQAKVWGSNAAGQQACEPGLPERSAIRLIASTEDTDQDGMSDAWEREAFGSLESSGGADPDDDGLPDIQEYTRGSDPLQADADGDLLTDFVDDFPNDAFNGESPTLTVIDGDKQYGLRDAFNAAPFEIAVWDATGTTPLAHVPVTFTVVAGSGTVSPRNDGTEPAAATIEARTDEDGLVRAYYRHTSATGLKSVVLVRAAAANLTVQTTSVGQPNEDDDLDGVTNADEIAQGTSPGDFYNGAFPQLSFVVGVDGQLGPQGLVTLQARRAADGAVLANAPVVFRFSSGTSLIAAAPGGAGLRNLAVRTDAAGIARGYVTLNGTAPQTLNGLAYSGAVATGVQTILRAPSLDSDGDGVTDAGEIAAGTDPTDYYNGAAPVVTPMFDTTDTSPYRFVSFRLTRAADGAVLANAPVRLEVVTGASSILNTRNGQIGSGFDARTDTNGIVRGMVVFNLPSVGRPDYLLVTAKLGSRTQVTPIFLPAPL